MSARARPSKPAGFAATSGGQRAVALPLVVAGVLTGLLGGCVVGPAYHPPTPPAVDGFAPEPLPARTAEAPGAVGTSGQAELFIVGNDPRDEWWRDFGVPDIDSLVGRGLAANPTLRAARESLGSARALALAGRGAFWPAVDAEFDAGRERSNDAYTGAATTRGLYDTFNARVAASYTVDLFGRQRQLVRSLDAEAEFTAENLRAARLAVSADIVTTMISIAALDAEIEATQALIDADRATMTIVRRRLEVGGASLLDVLSQQTELDQTEATLSPLRVQRENARAALAVLVGVPPSRFELPKLNLGQITLPHELPVSLPSRVLEQRPDVRAEEALVRSASAAVGVATADLLPQFAITAELGSQTNAAGDLLRGPFGVWDVGGQLLQPLFRGGELRHRRESAVHLYEASVATYQAAVLAALGNVANVLTAIQEDAELTRVATDGADAAARAVALARQSFGRGGASYVQVLVAEQAAERARLAAVRASAARYADVVALYQALGGGRPTPADAAPPLAYHP